MAVLVVFASRVGSAVTHAAASGDFLRQLSIVGVGEQCGFSGSTGYFFGDCDKGLRCVPPAPGSPPGAQSICYNECGIFGTSVGVAITGSCAPGSSCECYAETPCRPWTDPTECYMYCCSDQPFSTPFPTPSPTPSPKPSPTPSPTPPAHFCSAPRSGTNFGGKNIGDFGARDADDCRRKCEQHSQCLGYTFVSKSRNECWLKSARWSDIFQDWQCGNLCSSGGCSNWSSGQHSCAAPQRFKKFDGRNMPEESIYLSHVGLRQDEYGCQQACENFRECVGYTYVAAGDKQPECWLKDQKWSDMNGDKDMIYSGLC